ncbi:hypothetical protein [Viscerimonas tarda]
MENIQYEGLLGIMSEVNKKVDVIQANSKAKENQSVRKFVSKEEIEAIAVKYANAICKYTDAKHKEQAEHQERLLSAIHEVERQINALPTPEKVSLEPIIKLFPQPKKVTVCGFEFLRSSVIIFVLALVCFFSMVLNIKQMDDFRGLKTQLYKQTEYILHLEKTEKEKGKKSK